MLRPHTRQVTSLPLFRFTACDGLPHAISTRHGGVSPVPYATLNMGLSTGDSPDRVETNRKRLVETLGSSLERVALGRLRHGNEVTVFRQTDVTARDGNRTFTTDAAVSDVPELFLLLTFADCVPLLFWDCRRGVFGAAHAGWRGTALGIGPAVIEAMRRAFGSRPADITVGIGPSIGPCCYTVGPDVLRAFRAAGHTPVCHRQNGELRLDLWESNARQLRDAGIFEDSIENPRICTSCHVDTYYSHRAEGGRTGRFALCAGLS